MAVDFDGDSRSGCGSHLPTRSEQIWYKKSRAFGMRMLLEDFFLPAMKEAGYDSYYLPKLNSPAVKYGAPSDGCAIFYRASKFELNQTPLGSKSCRLR